MPDTAARPSQTMLWDLIPEAPESPEPEPPAPAAVAEVDPGDYFVRCNHCGFTKHKGTPGGCPKRHTGGWSYHGRQGEGS